MKALFIGRFQPFHKGHLNVIKNVSKKYDEIIIGLGSSQYSNSLENPFSSDERKEMIKKSLEQIGVKNYRIELIPDIHDLPRWASYVSSIVTDFDVVITNSPLTKQLFEEKGYKVEQTAILDRKKYSGKEIRRRIIKDEPWADLVPEPVVKIIKKIDGVNRLKKLSN
ncbi:MAG: nicotinamide-nucleotide adenylyltransferase [Candidatus Thermoplasmatota archaeon]|jgi:nicotinamide-nucleotide adenylyltransferase|nr:nicotinamide-nucleotide adenylyltransferase [Candidatus Thermoplasmatota archaeon]